MNKINNEDLLKYNLPNINDNDSYISDGIYYSILEILI